jgi:RNA polymerase sigma-70 factor (ECF subfamily)
LTDATTIADRQPQDPSTSSTDLRVLREGVVYMLKRKLRDPTLAEDFCNEAFRVVFEKLAHEPLQDPSKLAAYLAQTARNLAIDEARKSARRQTVTGQDEAIATHADPAAVDPVDELQTHARARAIGEVLAEMSTGRDRQVLVRYYLHDEDRAVLCRDFGLTEEHFNRVIYRARERFRKLLARRHSKHDLLCVAWF